MSTQLGAVEFNGHVMIVGHYDTCCCLHSLSVNVAATVVQTAHELFFPFFSPCSWGLGILVPCLLKFCQISITLLSGYP
jgi:hypothetical protein